MNERNKDRVYAYDHNGRLTKVKGITYDSHYNVRKEETTRIEPCPGDVDKMWITCDIKCFRESNFIFGRIKHKKVNKKVWESNPERTKQIYVESFLEKDPMEGIDLQKYIHGL